MEVKNNPELNYYPIDSTPDKSEPVLATNTSVVASNESNVVPSADGSILNKGIFKSPNFSAGVSGWKLDSNGTNEFGDGLFRGTFEIGGATKTIEDVADLQTSLDDVYAEGGGTVYLKAGTYTLTADITVPAGVTLEGVSRDSVIIDCNSSYAIKIAGSNAYLAGSVAISNGETTVVGSGTTWTAAMIGRYIFLYDYWYEITARTDNTHITIGTTYDGDVNLSGSEYAIADTVFTSAIKKLTITNATGSGIIVQYCMEPTLNDIIVSGCGTGLDLDFVVFPIIVCTSTGNGVNLDMNWVVGFFVDYSEFTLSTSGAGIVMTNSGNATFFNSSCNDNFGNGISMTNAYTIAFISLDISGNGDNGVELISGCVDDYFSSSVMGSNTNDGISFTATDDRNGIVNVSFTNNGGYGINIAASTCDNNQIVAPAFSGNTIADVKDLGTNTNYIPFGNLVAGDNLLISADTSRGGDGQTYIKYKEIECAETGTYRVKFDLATNSAGNLAYGKIYKNGVAYGAEQSNNSTTPATMSEDLAFVAGDLIQLYGKHADTNHACVLTNFRIYSGGRNTLTVITN